VVPPEGVKFILPSLAPLHLISKSLIIDVNSSGSVIVTVAVVSQLLLSVTVTV